MVFGRSPKQPIKFQIPLIQPYLRPTSTSSYVSALKDILKNAHDDARDHLRTAKHNQRENFDQHVNAKHFLEGD